MRFPLNNACEHVDAVTTVRKGNEVVSTFIATDKEVWRIAGLMLQEFGDSAVIEASMRADKALAESDFDNQGLWRRVIRAISALTAIDAETIH